MKTWDLMLQLLCCVEFFGLLTVDKNNDYDEDYFVVKENAMAYSIYLKVEISFLLENIRDLVEFVEVAGFLEGLIQYFFR